MSEIAMSSTQFSVGHGSFHHSVIHSSHYDVELSYVFDCGGASAAADSAVRNHFHAQNFLGSALWCPEYDFECHYHYLRRHRRYGPQEDKGTVDLAVISHLDADHVNGISALGELTSIHRLLLPYIDSASVISSAISGSQQATRRNLQALGDLAAVLTQVESVVEIQPPSADSPLDDDVPRPGSNNDQGAGPRWSWDERRKIASGNSLATLRGFGSTLWELTPFLTSQVEETWGEFGAILRKADPATAEKLDNASANTNVAHRIQEIVAVLSNPLHLRAVRRASHATYTESEADARPLLNPTSIALYSGPPAGPSSIDPALNVAWMHTGDLPLSDEGLFNNFVTQVGPDRARLVSTFSLAHHGAPDGLNAGLGKAFPNVRTALGCRCSKHRHPSPATLSLLKSIGWDQHLVLNERAYLRHVHV